MSSVRRWTSLTAQFVIITALWTACSTGDSTTEPSPPPTSTDVSPTSEPELFQRSTEEIAPESASPNPDPEESSNTSPSTSDEPPSSVSGTAVTEPASTDVEIPALLADALLSSDEVGVPDTWMLRDAVTERQLGGDDTLAFGVLPCPLGPPLTPTDGPWLRRRWSTPTEPLDDGLVAVEIVAEVQVDAALDVRLDELDDCSPGNVASVETARRETATPDGAPVTGATSTIYASPTATAAFPSHHTVAIAHSGNRTVTVVYSGVDMGQTWEDDAIALADRVLDRLT